MGWLYEFFCDRATAAVFFFTKDYGSRKCQFWDFLTIICSVYCSAQETFLRKEAWEWQCGARSGRVGQRTAH